MTEIATDTQALRDEQAARFTSDYIKANRLQYNDAGEADDPTQVGQWYCEIDRAQEPGWSHKGCACGCGLQVTNAKRNFLPGHDQRLMGILVRAHRENLEVMWTDGGMLIGGQGPMDYAELVLNDRGLAKLEAYLASTPKRVRKGGKAIGARDEAAEQAQAPKTDPLPETVKIGRWEYQVVDVERDGNGTVVAVTYRNKQGANMVTRTWGKLV